MKLFFVSTFLALTFIACSQPSENDNKQQGKADMEQEAQVSKNNANAEKNAGTTQFSMAPVIGAYLVLKNNLADDNSKAAAASGKRLFAILKDIDMASVPADKYKAYMDIADNAKENAEHIWENAGNIGHQREHFVSLSKDISDLIAMFGTPQKLYQNYCPMFNDGKGATWISETKMIRNPYYGSAIPTCGSVKKEY